MDAYSDVQNGRNKLKDKTLLTRSLAYISGSEYAHMIHLSILTKGVHHDSDPSWSI